MQQEESIDPTETGSRPCLDISRFVVPAENFSLADYSRFSLIRVEELHDHNGSQNPFVTEDVDSYNQNVAQKRLTEREKLGKVLVTTGTS